MLRAVIPLKKSSIHHNITVTSLSSAFQQCNITGSPPASMVLFRTIQASKASIRFENRLKTLREMRERGIEPEKPHNYAKLPCVDATQLAADIFYRFKPFHHLVTHFVLTHGNCTKESGWKAKSV